MGMRRLWSVALALLIALSITGGARAQAGAEAVLNDIDAYWAGVFAEAGLEYGAPRVALVEGALDTDCGYIDPTFGPGAYCALNATLYISPAWFGDLEIADQNAAFYVVMAHEWAHHIQTILGIEMTEPQADCLAGVYLTDAEERGVVTPGDLAQALRIVNSAGDVPWLDAGPFPHGTGQVRSLSLLTGQHNGLAGCGL